MRKNKLLILAVLACVLSGCANSHEEVVDEQKHKDTFVKLDAPEKEETPTPDVGDDEDETPHAINNNNVYVDLTDDTPIEEKNEEFEKYMEERDSVASIDDYEWSIITNIPGSYDQDYYYNFVGSYIDGLDPDSYTKYDSCDYDFSNSGEYSTYIINTLEFSNSDTGESNKFYYVIKPDETVYIYAY